MKDLNRGASKANSPYRAILSMTQKGKCDICRQRKVKVRRMDELPELLAKPRSVMSNALCVVNARRRTVHANLDLPDPNS